MYKPIQITLFGRSIALEALGLVLLSVVITWFVVRQLFYFFFIRSLYIWGGLFIALGGFGLAALRTPSDMSLQMQAERKPFRATFKQYAFTKGDKWNQEVAALEDDKEEPFSLYPDSFLVSDSFNQLIEYVIRDFVLSWYKSISADPTFPSHVDHTLRLVLSRFITQSTQINWADLIVTKMVPIVSEHFRKFTAADAAVREKSMGRVVTDNNEFQYAVALQYSQGRLHPALFPLKHYQYDSYRKNWLRGLCEKLVPVLIGQTATSTVANHLARDIAACSVLFPSLTMLSDPDFWNQLIVNFAGPTLQDRKKVEQLRKALNEHATLGSSTGPKPSKSSATDSAMTLLKPTADQNDYSKFIKNLKKCKSVTEARQILYYITVQIQRASKDKMNTAYVNNLNVAKEAVDKLLAKLTGALPGIVSEEEMNTNMQEGGLLNEDTRRGYTLVQILNEPTFRLSFMEYMNLSKRTQLVEFWLTMNGLRNPLEVANGDDDEDSNDNFDSYEPLSSKRNSQDFSSGRPSNRNSRVFSNNSEGNPNDLALGNDKDYISVAGSLATENDIYQIYNTYFGGKISCISNDAQAAVQRYVEASKKTPELLTQARRALIYTQTAVFKEMQEVDLVKYKKSDVFLNFLASGRKKPLAVGGRQTESTIDSLQMDSISDYEEPNHEREQNQPNAKDVEDIEKVFNTIMGNKGTSSSGSKSNIFNISDSTAANSFFSKPGNRLGDLVEDNKEFKDSRSKDDKDKGKRKRASGGLTPLFDDSDSDMYSDMDSGEEAESDEQMSELHLAAPGDLGLTEAINMLTKQIKVLYRQEKVLEPLLRKAELTNNVGNLRVLRISKASLEREIQRKELQRQQYIVQESDNSLYGRSNIQIRSYMSAQDSNGPFILYVIEVERLASDGNISAGWVVARRYSQFFQLHQLLRSMFPQVRKLPFPKKRVVLKFQQKSFADARRIGLQKYLRSLLQMPAVCRSKAFRMFLSSETFSIDSVKDSIDNSTKEGAAAAAALAATAGSLESSLYADNDDNINSEDTGSDDPDQSGLLGGVVGNSATDYASMALEAEAEVDDPTHKPFIQPICDLFIQVFGFDRGNNWVRGRAVVVVVQQILGGTIERRIRDTIMSSLASEQGFTDAVQKLFDSMWPQGASFMETRAAKHAIPVRSGAEKMSCKHDARVIVYTLIRDACVKIVGSTSSRYASYNLFEMFQHEKLNAHLVYSLLDVLIDEMFPDVI